MSRSIITDEIDKCHHCGGVKTDIHHCILGSRRKLADMDGLVVPLCRFCHHKVHQDPLLTKYYKQLGQRAYERTRSREEWLVRYGKNYL